jgi:hypothetical protein
MSLFYLLYASKAKESKRNGTQLLKQEKEKDTSFPLGAGETTRDELCGSQTLLQLLLSPTFRDN